MKRVIVTGATGAIGTALIKELVKNGIETLVFCRRDSKRNQNIPHHPLVNKLYCTLSDLSFIQNTTGKTYDVFFHLAWEGTTGSSRNDMYLQNQNVKHALDAVMAASRFGCKKFIGIGSQAEYGRSEEVLKPNSATFPETGYGIAKLCAGHMTRVLASQLEMEHMWVRVLSIYGPNDWPGSMVMSTISNLKKGIVPSFTKGEQVWDYLYSGDAARALFLLGDCGVNGKIYVLGSGTAKPLKEYIEELRDVVSPNSKLIFGSIPYAKNQVMHLKADISELQKDVKWNPEVSFSKGIRFTVESLSCV